MGLAYLPFVAVMNSRLGPVINLYNAGAPTPMPTGAQKNDPLFPRKDPLLQRLGLNEQEKEDLLAFLDSLSEPKLRVRPPELPGMAQANSGPTTKKSG